MAMLIGSYEHRLESKGRLVLPARFREDLGDSLVASIGIEHCIAVYSLDRWSELFEKLKSLSYSKERSRAFLRLFLAMAHEISVDPTGRVLIPQPLRDHASLKNRVCVTGVGDHLEIWDYDLWEEYRSRALSDFPRIVEEVGGY